MERYTIIKAVKDYCSRNAIDPAGWAPKAALIDMDGTLIDSMRNHTRRVILMRCPGSR